MNAKVVYEEISTESDLRNLDQNGRYVITNDIYLAYEWKPLDFNGVISSKLDDNGNAYTIYNVNISKNGLKDWLW